MIDGLPPGLYMDLEAVQELMDRRRPGRSELSSSRQEEDRVMVLSGLMEGRTTGAPLAMTVGNRDARSGAYDRLREVFRPGHADITFQGKYGLREWRGGGRASGRETVARVAAGAVALQLLEPRGISIFAHTVQVGGARARAFREVHMGLNPLRCADHAAAQAMEQAIHAAREQGDSVGGAVEVVIRGAPGPWLEHEAGLMVRLSEALVSIGAVKALAAREPREAGELRVELTVKPTPSINLPQRTVNTSGEAVELRVGGRHDPCIVPRILPVAEAMAALVLADMLLAP